MKIKLNRLNALSWSSFTGLFYLFLSTQPVNALTFVLDFNDPGQANTRDRYNAEVSTFDVTTYGFTATDFDLVTNSILDKVESHFYDIPTVGEDSRSPIPDGKELDIDFEIGDILNAPTNGDSEYYFMQIGSAVSSSIASLGQAGLGIVRSSTGVKNPFNSTGNNLVVGSTFTDNINNLGGLSSFLKSGNLDATTNAIAGTISHEIGHTLSLDHVYKASSQTPNDLPPLLGTGALDLPNIDRISDRSFSFTAFGEGSTGDTEEPNPFEPIVLDGLEPHIDVGRDPFAPIGAIPTDAPTLNNIQRLYDVVDVRDSVAVPFEFSPGMGLILVGGTWGIASLRKKLSK